MGANIKDISNIKTGLLTPVKFIERRNNKSYWLYKCECGNAKIISSYRVKSGDVKSCGCYRRKVSINNLSNRINKEETGIHAKTGLYFFYKKSAKNRGIFFELEKEIFLNTVCKNCHYCDSPPSNKCNLKKRNDTGYYIPFVYNGLDRVNNNEGYIESNILPCCWICNRAKQGLMYDDFIAYINRAYHFINKI